MNVDSITVYVSEAACNHLIDVSIKTGRPVHCPDMVSEVAEAVTVKAKRFIVTAGMVWWEGSIGKKKWTVSTKSENAS